jgi:hypothetical protein
MVTYGFPKTKRFIVPMYFPTTILKGAGGKPHLKDVDE